MLTLSFFNSIADGALLIFYSSVLFIALKNFKRLFTPSFARDHRVLGLLYISWLLFGLFINHYHKDKTGVKFADSLPAQGDVAWFTRIFLTNRSMSYFIFDLVLGVLGITLTLSAAFGFKTAHAKVKNRASGALDEDATITYSEMIEHSFYQVLNLFQAVFLHTIYRVSFFYRRGDDLAMRIVLYLICTVLPWYFRSMFTTNSFSANYKDKSKDFKRVEGIMYFIKKYQYAVLYKHFLFHGLNLTLVLVGTGTIDPHHTPSSKSASTVAEIFSSLVISDSWRRYWLVLNTAYTFEFFLQTLVKKGFLKQKMMLLMNIALMIIGSAGALPVIFQYTDWIIAGISTWLNFNFRGHEVRNCLITMVMGLSVLYLYEPGNFMDETVCGEWLMSDDGNALYCLPLFCR